MTSRDTYFLVFAFWAITGIQFVIAYLMGHKLDDFDHTHALLLAVGYTLGRVIRRASL